MIVVGEIIGTGVLGLPKVDFIKLKLCSDDHYLTFIFVAQMVATLGMGMGMASLVFFSLCALYSGLLLGRCAELFNLINIRIFSLIHPSTLQGSQCTGFR